MSSGPFPSVIVICWPSKRDPQIIQSEGLACLLQSSSTARLERADYTVNSSCIICTRVFRCQRLSQTIRLTPHSLQFVVDGTWTTDHTAPQETDEAGNVNNVLLPENMSKQPKPSLFSNMISGITPGSSTTKMAAQVPKEGEREVRPGTSGGSPPETPFHDAQEFGVDPIPATTGPGNPVSLAAGEPVPHPNTLTSNTVGSTVRDDPSLKKDGEQTFGVAPLPATTGIGNPVSLQPGEKVPDPSSFTSNTINSNVTLDKDSYENSGATTQAEAQHPTSGGTFSVPPFSKNMIPESSLPMGGPSTTEKDAGPIIQSAGAGTTTAALAGQVPLEPRGVPEVVSKSQQEAGVGPEAASNEEAVKEKSAMEKELESKVPEEPATSKNTTGAAVAGGVAVAGAAAYASKSLPSSVQQSIGEMNKGGSSNAIAPTVPDVVQESITESHQSPEAAGDKNMVGEKSAMEKELLKKTPTENMAGEPAPSSTAALTETAPAATDPAPTNGSAGMSTAAAPAKPPVTEAAALQTPTHDSRDVSPMSKPGTTGQTQPMVTTGVGSSTAPQTTTPAKSAASAPSPTASSSAATDKKAKRSSGFFGKIKSKLSGKDKE